MTLNAQQEISNIIILKYGIYISEFEFSVYDTDIDAIYIKRNNIPIESQISYDNRSFAISRNNRLLHLSTNLMDKVIIRYIECH